MFAQLVSKQAMYSMEYGNAVGRTVFPRYIAVSPFPARFICVYTLSRAPIVLLLCIAVS